MAETEQWDATDRKAAGEAMVRLVKEIQENAQKLINVCNRVTAESFEEGIKEAVDGLGAAITFLTTKKALGLLMRMDQYITAGQVCMILFAADDEREDEEMVDISVSRDAAIYLSLWAQREDKTVDELLQELIRKVESDVE